MEIHKSEDCDPKIIEDAHEIYNSINEFAYKQFHLKHGKLCNIKPKQRKRK